MRIFAINRSRGSTPLICVFFALLIRSSHVHKALTGPFKSERQFRAYFFFVGIGKGQIHFSTAAFSGCTSTLSTSWPSALEPAAVLGVNLQSGGRER